MPAQTAPRRSTRTVETQFPDRPSDDVYRRSRAPARCASPPPRVPIHRPPRASSAMAMMDAPSETTGSKRSLPGARRLRTPSAVPAQMMFRLSSKTDHTFPSERPLGRGVGRDALLAKPVEAAVGRPDPEAAFAILEEREDAVATRAPPLRRSARIVRRGIGRGRRPCRPRDCRGDRGRGSGRTGG